VEDPSFVREEDRTDDQSFHREEDRTDDQSITASPPRRRKASSRRIEQLIFVGLNGYALALDRDSGEIVWSNNEMRSGYVSLLLDGDRLIVSTNGYMYCLDPLTGKARWNNPLTGYGLGAPTALTSIRGQSTATLMQQAHELDRRSSD
jgi:hypothetical protein